MLAVAAIVIAALVLIARGANLFGGSDGGGSGSPLAGATAVQLQPQCTGYTTYGVPHVPPLDPGKTYQAIVQTNLGSFTITFLPTQAPATVQSFVFLAQHHYFDGVRFHRVVPHFVIQGGDPTGTGLCGPGYEFPTQNAKPPYTRGTVAMANAGKDANGNDTNGSQFFIVLDSNSPSIQGLNSQPNYSIFGHVTSGMSVVDKIAAVPLAPGADGSLSAPRTKVYMQSVRIVVS